jgi:hypothetical protein
MNQIEVFPKIFTRCALRLHFLKLPLVALSVAATGCAGVSYRTIPDEIADNRARGFRYYDPSLYLLVQTDNKGGLTSQIISLPDTSKLRQATPYKFLAQNNATFNFTNGVLTTGNNNADETAIPNAFIQALETTATAAIKSGILDNPQAKKTTPQVYLFKIAKISGEWTLLGASGEPLNF